MKSAKIPSIAFGLVAAVFSSAVQAQPANDLGKTEYYAKCAACHGIGGKGDGSFSEMLKMKMPDLTTIAKRHGGVFPVEQVKMTIDGRATPRAHGTSAMPIWGTRYSIEAAPQYDEFRYDSEAFVKARVLSLVDYLDRLQVR